MVLDFKEIVIIDKDMVIINLLDRQRWVVNPGAGSKDVENPLIKIARCN